MTIILRPAVRTDFAFIYATWSQHDWYSDPKRQDLNQIEWFKAKNALIKSHLDSSEIQMACAEDEPNFIVGYLVLHEGQPAFQYIKKDYRRDGIEELFKTAIAQEDDPHEFIGS
jgi:hypothetical protein